MHKYYEPTAIPDQSEAITPPILGTWHMVSATVEKWHNAAIDDCTRWQRRQCEPRKMMFIGVRQVREGMMVDVASYDYEDGLAVHEEFSRAFQAKRFITTWLMIIDGHKNPVHVLPGDAVGIPTPTERSE